MLKYALLCGFTIAVIMVGYNSANMSIRQQVGDNSTAIINYIARNMLGKNASINCSTKI